MSASVSRFHTIVLQVSDLARSAAFYERALGAAFARQSERAVQAKIGETSLLLHADYEAELGRRGAGVHVNFAVTSADAHRTELERAGLAPGAIEARPWGRQFALTDPDGYVLEFLGPRA
jgi:catechol 2,3-dioxygenase-like lactoylglutathione lyase family enzyme